MANVLKQFRRRYIYPWLKPLYPYKLATLAGTRVSYKNHLDGGGRGFGQDFTPLLQGLGLPRQPRAFEWYAGPGLSDSRCWAMACARRSVSPISILNLKALANARSRTTPYLIACPSVVPTIFATYRSLNNGIWLFPIHPISSTSTSEIFAHKIRTGAFTVISSGQLHLFSSAAPSLFCRKTMPAQPRTRFAP